MSTARNFKGLIERLSPEQREKVRSFIDALGNDAVPPVGVKGESLLAFAGAVSQEDADAMAHAIEEGCERADEGEW